MRARVLVLNTTDIEKRLYPQGVENFNFENNHVQGGWYTLQNTVHCTKSLFCYLVSRTPSLPCGLVASCYVHSVKLLKYSSNKQLHRVLRSAKCASSPGIKHLLTQVFRKLWCARDTNKACCWKYFVKIRVLFGQCEVLLLERSKQKKKLLPPM